MTAATLAVQPRGGARLLHAAGCLRRVAPASAAEYRTLCLRLPALLRKSGLSETAAFLERSDVGKVLVVDLEATLGRINLAQLAQSDRNVERYLELSAEVLEVAELFALLAWEPTAPATSPREIP